MHIERTNRQTRRCVLMNTCAIPCETVCIWKLLPQSLSSSPQLFRMPCVGVYNANEALFANQLKWNISIISYLAWVICFIRRLLHGGSTMTMSPLECFAELIWRLKVMTSQIVQHFIVYRWKSLDYEKLCSGSNTNLNGDKSNLYSAVCKNIHLNNQGEMATYKIIRIISIEFRRT